MFKFIRLTSAGERRERMTLEDKRGASYQLLFLDGKITMIEKASEQSYPNPFQNGSRLSRTKSRIIKGSAALHAFANQQYADIKAEQDDATATASATTENAPSTDSSVPRMTAEQLDAARKRGAFQCLVEAGADGYLCWDRADTREREPVHRVSKGDYFWCWSFKTKEDGTYTHEYGNMSPPNIPIDTDVPLTLIYLTDDAEDKWLYTANAEKSPNVS